MSKEQYDDNCEGCKPVIIDPETGEPLSASHPVMEVVQKIFTDLSREHKESFHRFCCLNSRAPEDLAAIQHIQQKIRDKVG